MTLTDNLTPLLAVLAKLPQQKIAQAISVLLLIYITFMAAKFTWLVVEQKPVLTNGAKSKYVSAKSNGEQNFNITSLQSLNLFGQYNEQVKEKEVTIQVTDAPETRLQLTLSGIVASDDVSIAAAIIENKKKQQTYGIGDIIDGTRASLEQVLIDRVIIKQSGRLETLMLDGADYMQPAQSVSHKKEIQQASLSKKEASQAKSNVIDQRMNQDLSKNAQQLRSYLTNDFSKITDYLRISPSRKDGRIVGYRLSPGKNPDFFKLAGLKPGDIALQMNGLDLLIPSEAALAMMALKNEKNISLLIDRKSDLIEILFSID